MPNLGRRFGQSYVAKLSPAGNFDWVATSNTSNFGEFGQGMAIDHGGGVYATGYYGGAGIGFGNNSLMGNPGAYTGFLTKLSDSPLPRVASVLPSSGVAGTVVTGRGARLAGATVLYFNGQPAASFTVTSPTTLTAVAPVGVTSGPLNVQTPAGTSPNGLVFEVGTVAAQPVTATCWPNPIEAGGLLHLELPGGGATKPSQVALYTLLGQRVFAAPMFPTGDLQLPKLPGGSYLVVVSTPNQATVRYALLVE
jgi:hypothetical protein